MKLSHCWSTHFVNNSTFCSSLLTLRNANTAAPLSYVNCPKMTKADMKSLHAVISGSHFYTVTFSSQSLKLVWLHVCRGKHITSSSGMMVTHTSCTMSVQPASRRTAASTTHTCLPGKRITGMLSWSQFLFFFICAYVSKTSTWSYLEDKCWRRKTLEEENCLFGFTVLTINAVFWITYSARKRAKDTKYECYYFKSQRNKN